MTAIDKTKVSQKELYRSYDFAGKTFVFTGGTGVLGRSIVYALASSGANVAVLHVNPASGAKLQEYLGPLSEKVQLLTADVLNKTSVEEAASKVLARFGRIDGLINGAGGNKKEATASPEMKFFDLPTEALRWVFDLNLIGSILPSQIFGKLFAEQREGVILNFSSMSADRSLTRVLAYSAAKAGINNFTSWLAVHMAQEYSPAIRVNAIAPGFFLTDQNRFLLTDKETGELSPRGKSIVGHTPMGRFGEPQDLVGACLWLLSPAAAFVTGTVIAVDGGFSAFSGV